MTIMEKHAMVELMETTMQKIRDIVDANTIVGDPIITNEGITIIPLSKMSFGFASGGADFDGKTNEKVHFGGGSGAGVSVVPVGFLVINDGAVRLLPVEATQNTYEKLIDIAPELINKVSAMFKKDEENPE